MGKWADRLKEELAETPPGTTDKTDKRGVLSVLSVPDQWGSAENSETADSAHSPASSASHAMDLAARKEFDRRRAHLLLWGLPVQQAEALAARLAARDLDADDRRMCLECVSLERTGRCARARMGKLVGADRALEPVRDILQRCPSFVPCPVGKPENAP